MITLIKRKGDKPGTDEPLYFPRWTSMGTVTKKDLAKKMARNSTYSVGEVEGILTDFSQFICDALLEGQTVDIDGLGTFRLKVSGQSQPDAKNVTTEGVTTDVRFAPDPDLRQRLDTESEFQFITKPSRVRKPKDGK